MLASNSEFRPKETQRPLVKSKTETIRQAIRDELASEAAKPTSSSQSTREHKEHKAEMAALASLDRLLRFLDSMQSTSGRSKQLRDFARLNERTRAAQNAKILAIEADEQ